MSDCWAVLGVSAGSDERAIKRAYARKLRVIGGAEGDPAKFTELREAYEQALAGGELLDEASDLDFERAWRAETTFMRMVRQSVEIFLMNCGAAPPGSFDRVFIKTKVEDIVHRFEERYRQKAPPSRITFHDDGRIIFAFEETPR